MSEQDAFLKEILANPADREVRLVFADWLEENGDPRGELIRRGRRAARDESESQRADGIEDRMESPRR